MWTQRSVPIRKERWRSGDMTGSTSSAIDAVVTQWNTGKKRDVSAALKDDAEMVTAIRAEIARLETVAARRYLLHPDRGDAVSKKLHANLCEILISLDG